MEMMDSGFKPPPASVLAAFRATEKPCRFSGGQGTTWASGPIVLKPEADSEQVNWIASLFDEMPQHESFRVSKPIKSTKGTWLEDGWVAWTKLEGATEIKNRFKEKFLVCDAFHKAISSVKRARFLNSGLDPWSVADRVAWQEQEISFHPALAGVVSQIEKLLVPLSLPSQAIHGDMLGNFMFAEGKTPVVIDFSPYWRPAGFAKGVMIADAIAWTGATADIFVLSDDSNLRQFALRGALRRIAEEQQHMVQAKKSLDDVLSEVQGYENILQYAS